MPRSKTLHKVTRTHTIEQPNDSTLEVIESQVDFSLELSRTLGRTIRQGQNFRVVGFNVTVTPSVLGDFDMGGAVVARSYYAPTTYHTSEAWRQVFAQWRKQKFLAGKVGRHMAYDDFEVAYTADHISTGRTSTILGSGMGDTTPEHVVIYGGSTDGTDFSIQDYYNSQHPVGVASKDPFTNAPIKEPKFTVKFPGANYLTANATLSAQVADLGSAQGDAWFGGEASLSDIMFPSDNHVNVLAGVSGYKVWYIPPDTLSQNADSLVVTLEWLIEGWNTLVRSPKKKSRRTMKKKSSSYRRKPRRSYRRT